MIFELGKRYIVDVTEKGIVPLMEFDEGRWYDKEHDDLEFLTDEEKVVVINTVLDKIRDEIKEKRDSIPQSDIQQYVQVGLCLALDIIDKYKAESGGKK